MKRAARTRVKLEESLLALFAERGYERTSVRALVGRAGVGKSTFYEHFRDKDAVLDSRLARLARTLRAAGAGGRVRFSFVEPLLEHVNAHPGLGARLERSSGGALVLGRFRRFVRTLVAEELARAHPDAGAERLALASEHVTGSLVSLLEVCGRELGSIDRSAVATAFRRLVEPGLEAWLRAHPAPT